MTGRSLSDVIQSERSLRNSWRELALIGLSLCAALAAIVCIGLTARQHILTVERQLEEESLAHDSIEGPGPILSNLSRERSLPVGDLQSDLENQLTVYDSDMRSEPKKKRLSETNANFSPRQGHSGYKSSISIR